MADWASPVVDDLKVDVLDMLKLRDIDSITLAENPANPPVLAKRWNHATKTFQEWDGAAWNDLVLSFAGGGTGVASGVPLGTMAFQNSNNVAITAGTITGLSNLAVSGNAHFNGLMYSGPANTIQLTGSNGQILETAIADGTIYARVGANESISGAWNFQNEVRLSSTIPIIWFYETDGPANAKYWRFVAEGGIFYLQTMNDAGTVIGNLIKMTRNGTEADTTITSHTTFALNVGVNGTFAASSTQYFYGTTVWNGGTFQFQAQALPAPEVGRFLFGDGSGWRLSFIRPSTGVAFFDFVDTGLFRTKHSIEVGRLSGAAPVYVALLPYNGPPGFFQSYWSGVSANFVLVTNNYYSPNGGASGRWDNSAGGSYLALGYNELYLRLLTASGVDNTAFYMSSNRAQFYDKTVAFYSSGAECGYISPEISPSRITVNGTSWLTLGVGAQVLQFRGDSFIYASGAHPAPLVDVGLYCGHPSFRWHTVFAAYGVSTSDVRGKEYHGQINNASEFVKNLDVGIYSLPEVTLDTGEVVPAFKLPAFTAQDIDRAIDSRLGTGIVRKENPESWGVNYSALIPILWAAVRELLEKYDNN